jgi:hypothetical protein
MGKTVRPATAYCLDEISAILVPTFVVGTVSCQTQNPSGTGWHML